MLNGLMKLRVVINVLISVNFLVLEQLLRIFARKIRCYLTSLGVVSRQKSHALNTSKIFGSSMVSLVPNVVR